MKTNQKTTMSNNYPWGRHLLLTFVATTLSIILTFGTSELIEHKKKEDASRQMIMFIIHDLEKSLKQMEEADGKLRQLSDLFIDFLKQEEPVSKVTLVAASSKFFPNITFSETAEHIFNSDPQIWSTLDNVHFIDKVSEAYILRRSYIDHILNSFKKDWEESPEIEADAILHQFDIDSYVIESSILTYHLKTIIIELKQMMNVSDEDLNAFVERYNTPAVSQAEKDSVGDVFVKEFYEKTVLKDSL